MTVVGVIAAGGSGERLGASVPKAFVVVGGKGLYEWSLEVLRQVCDRVLVAVPPEGSGVRGQDFIVGGSSRSASVRNAVLAEPDADVYVVHDAARPLVEVELVERCLAALEGVEGAIAAARVTDTVKETDDGGRVLRTLDRSTLWAVQTPQVFRGDALRSALDADEAVLAAATDDASLVEEAGGTIAVVEAPRENLKVTTPLDLRVAEAVLESPVLTDYHVHLRPDEDDTPAGEYFTPANAERYREAASERGIEELGVSEHIHRFVQALDVWTHPWWRRWARDDIDEYCSFVREQTDLRLGIEADFVAGREDRMASLLEAREWDYVVGSVHFLRDEAVDMRGTEWDVWREGDPEKVWARYFETLGEAARTGMFDILAHPDLVKVWGGGAPFPDGDLRRFYERAMDGIADSDVAIEVSTAGLRKPVKEIYPARGFLEMCLDAGRPVALSSDAHLPEDLGHGYDRAVEWLGEIGVTELAVFEQRRRRLEPIG